MLRALTTHRRHWSGSELEVGSHSPGQDRAPFILTLPPSLDIGSSCCSFLGRKAPRILLALRFRDARQTFPLADPGRRTGMALPGSKAAHPLLYEGVRVYSSYYLWGWWWKQPNQTNTKTSFLSQMPANLPLARHPRSCSVISYRHSIHIVDYSLREMKLV